MSRIMEKLVFPRCHWDNSIRLHLNTTMNRQSKYANWGIPLRVGKNIVSASICYLLKWEKSRTSSPSARSANSDFIFPREKGLCALG